ncbi:MAG: TonB-dependent receptor [Bacteroidales bacterium]|nr:TonB-dependent receptor [Bacteroidales bacterium]
MKGRFIRKIAAAFAAVLVTAATAAGQSKVTVSGYMTDAASGESLISATLLDRISGQGAVTNNYGFYTLTLPAGEVSLEYSYTGYETVVKEFRLTRDTVIHVGLTFSPEMLSGATVTASRSEIGVRGTQMSAIEIPVNQIRRVPALAGEVDVIKAIQLLPGVQSGTEGSAGLYVRGGGPDENLLLLDGVPIYNVNHMMGFFSVFNADAIKNVTLYKGSFPARFGSRLSSIVDVRMKDGNDQAWHGSASLGLLSAKVNVEGPIVKGKTTFNVSARRTYYDVLAQPLIALYMRNNRENGDQATGGYYFYDLNAKLTHTFSNRDKLYASYYMGDDRVYARLNMSDGSTDTRLNMGWNWGNIVGSLRWNHVFGPRLFVNTTVNYTQYRHLLDITGNERYQGGANTDFTLGYNSLINDLSAAADFEFNPVPEHDIRFGGTFIHHTFKPSVTTVRFSESAQKDAAIDTTFGDRNLFTNEAALYAEDNWSITPWLKVNLGLRYSLYATSGRTYHSLEPRVSLRALFTDDFSFKASYSEMSQAVHLLSNSNISLPTDLWVPSTDRIEPMRSKQAAAGLFYSLGVVDLSLEGYYKHMDNVLEYRDGASFFGSTTGWEDKVAMGKGWAYGVEFLVQKKTGRLTGWIGYTWSKTMRQFDREGHVINFGKPFPAKYDRRHDLSITAAYELTKKIDLAATFVYGTGVCGSLALQTIQAMPGYDRQFDYYMLADTFPVDYLEGRNNYRMPSYQRLDLGVNFKRTFRNGHHRTISLSVFNAYNRNNPFLVYRDGKQLVQLSIFPIMPSLSYTYEF